MSLKRKREDMEAEYVGEDPEQPEQPHRPKPKGRKKRVKTEDDPVIETVPAIFKVVKEGEKKRKNAKGSVWPRMVKMLKLEGYDQYPPNIPTYTSIAAPPSLMPQQKYCDITGYEASYTDPKTGLRYHNAEVFQFIRHSLNTHERQQDYLALRNAHTVIK